MMALLHFSSGKNKNTRNNGFTLIELLVVIAIIGVLSSIVITAVQSAREQAAASKVVTTMKQFRQALELYKEEVGNYPKDINAGGYPAKAGEGRIGRKFGTEYDGGDLNKLVEKGFLPSLPEVPEYFMDGPNQYFDYFESTDPSADYRCGGVNVGGKGEYVLFYYYLGDGHGEVPDNYPTYYAAGTSYDNVICITSKSI